MISWPRRGGRAGVEVRRPVAGAIGRRVSSEVVKRGALVFDTVNVMRDGDCPYLRFEKTARRLHGLTVDQTGPMEVSEAWYCRHPFHGVEVPVADDRAEAERACAFCALPDRAGASLADGERGAARPCGGRQADEKEGRGTTPA